MSDANIENGTRALKELPFTAQVLQSADKDIQPLKAKAEKLRENKKGLMQQMLTGKKLMINKDELQFIC